MLRFLNKLRSQPPNESVLPLFEIVCVCGTALTGTRADRPQTISCPQCGMGNFVLPRSPLPAPTALSEAVVVAAVPATRLPWVILLLSGLLVTGLTASYFLVRGYWLRQPAGKNEPERLARHRDRGRAALDDGSFQLAARELEAALALARRFPDVLSAAELRELRQLHRQSALLADLLHEPLTALLQLAASSREQEWVAVFGLNYRGKAVLFDAEVRRTEDGQYQMSYVVSDGAEPARVGLEGITLLRTLPLDQPQRLLFGARLADIIREPTQQWSIRFLPNSGVLFTDPAAVEAGLVVPVDESLRLVLERQRDWLREREE